MRIPRFGSNRRGSCHVTEWHSDDRPRLKRPSIGECLAMLLHDSATPSGGSRLDPVPSYGVYPWDMAPRDSALTIDKLANAAGVGGETIRFYERAGLLPKPPRKRSGYRQYPPDAVARVMFIRSAKDLGFTLKEITALLELRVDPDKSCADVRALAKAKIVDVEEKMADLARIRGALEKLAKACRGKGPTSECPILDAIEKEDGRANG